MAATRKNKFTICILGGRENAGLEDCIRKAKEMTDQVLFLASGTRETLSAGPAEFGTIHVDEESLNSAITNEWVFFLKPREFINIASRNGLLSLLKDKNCHACGILVKDHEIVSSLNNFVFMRTLGQYSQIGNHASVTRIENRLVRKGRAVDYARELVRMNPDTSTKYDKITFDVFVEQITDTDPTPGEKKPKDNDLFCLKGLFYCGSVREDKIDELNTGYIGFRVLNNGFIDSFMETAERGWGADGMFMPMLEYLNKNGMYQESTALYEKWISKRKGRDNADIHAMGSVIYANLFMFDQAIACYEKAIRIIPRHSFHEYMGKLHLLNGNRDKAIECFKKSIELKPDAFHEHVLSMIQIDNWTPMTLSVCMIARDEEVTIGKAITSVKDIADEIIVADTGSSDKTVEIAKSLGARIIDFKWNDDFSAARNASIKEAGSDYILVLDADEFINTGDRLSLAFLKKILAPNRDVAFRINIIEDLGVDQASIALLNAFLKQVKINRKTRIFPRIPSVFFEGRVFESAEPSLSRSGLPVIDMPFNITEQKINTDYRSERKLTAVKKSFVEISDQALFLEGALYFLRRGELEEAYKWLMKAGKLDSVMAYKAALLYAEQEKYQQAREIIDLAPKDSSGGPELLFALAHAHFLEDNYTEANEILAKLAIRDDLPPELRADSFYYYGICLVEADRLPEGIGYIAKAMAIEPLRTKYQIGGLYSLARSGEWDQFLETVGLLIRREEVEIDFTIGDFADIGRLMLIFIRHFALAGKRDEVRMCNKLMEHLIRAKVIGERELVQLTSLTKEGAMIAVS